MQSLGVYFDSRLRAIIKVLPPRNPLRTAVRKPPCIFLDVIVIF